MNIQTINNDLLSELLSQASMSERKRVAFDLRTTPEDTSQRMLNAMQPGTVVPIHRHDDTSETCICIKGKLDVIFYSELPNMDAGGPGRDFTEILRVTLSPESGNHGCQIPQGVWHSVHVTEPTIIMEAKDGAYKPSPSTGSGTVSSTVK